VEDAGLAEAERGAVVTGLGAATAGFDPDEADRLVVDEAGEQPGRVRSPADAGHGQVGQPSLGLQELGASLVADDPLELPDHQRIGVGTDHRADGVVGGADRLDPVPQGLVDGVLEGRGAGGHRPHLGAEQPHAHHVEVLAPGVLLAHVDDALLAEEGGHGGGGHAVLAGAGLGDHPRLAHPAGQQVLAEGVVELVGPGVEQVLALEPDPQAQLLRQPAGREQGGRAAGIVAPQRVQLGVEGGVPDGVLVRLGELVEGGHQDLGDEPPTPGAEVAQLVGPVRHPGKVTRHQGDFPTSSLRRP
jgi:hypothetical protein